MAERTRMCLGELFCTYLLVLIGAGAVCAASLPGSAAYYNGTGGVAVAVALAEGAAVAIAVSAALLVSPGCCNTAITLTRYVARQIELGPTLSLVAAQLLGGFLAGMTLRGVFPTEVLLEARLGTPHLKLFLASDGTVTLAGLAVGVLLEMLFTALVTLTAFATLLDGRAMRLGALPLGLAQMAVVLFGYQLTGAAANPARWFGPMLCQFSLSLPGTVRPLADHPVYWLGPILGALACGVFYVWVLAPRARP